MLQIATPPLPCVIDCHVVSSPMNKVILETYFKLFQMDFRTNKAAHSTNSQTVSLAVVKFLSINFCCNIKVLESMVKNDNKNKKDF